VVDRNGTPQGGATVRLLTAVAGLPPIESVPAADLVHPPAVTGDNGLAVIENVGPGDWEVMVYSRDRSLSTDAALKVSGNVPVYREVILDDSTIIRGIVVDGLGVPIAGANVAAATDPLIEPTRTDTNGAFTLFVRDGATLRIMVWGGVVVGSHEWQARPGDELTVSVPRKPGSVTVRGVVQDSRDGEVVPIASYDLSITKDWDGGSYVRRMQIAGGVFEIAIPSFISGTLSFSAPGYLDRNFELEDVVSTGSYVEVSLDRKGD